eukprot:TRINITY_DN74611_c0_g1_i1.p1 TRINITY_DN74611_c0_g1~~TRINITY_DN74611_c0_g1_i1.p1  ORF type:complete len:561 (+),score=45.84 TRINITY_DN74611_c0_g1_i1:123-1685(+)
MFDSVVVCVGFMNLLVAVHATDLRARNDDIRYVHIADILFLLFYVVEIIIRMYVDRLRFFASWLNRIDFAIITVDLIMESLGSLYEPPSVGWLRIFRLLRFMRVLRRTDGFQELWLLLFGIKSTLKTVLWGAFLIILILLVSSLIGVELLRPIHFNLRIAGTFDDVPHCSDVFDTVGNAMFTWFLLMFVGDLWVDLVIPIVRAEPSSVVLFACGYIMFHLGVFNLLLSVIVDRASNARLSDEEKQNGSKTNQYDKARQKLSKLCFDLDKDQSGTISLQELLNGYRENATLRSTLHSMDVNEQDLHGVFDIIDTNQANAVTNDQFVEGLCKLKEQDLHVLSELIYGRVREVERLLSEQIGIIKSERIGNAHDQTAIGKPLSTSSIDICLNPICAHLTEDENSRSSSSSLKAENNVSNPSCTRSKDFAGTLYDFSVVQQMNLVRPMESDLSIGPHDDTSKTLELQRIADRNGALGGSHEQGHSERLDEFRQHAGHVESMATVDFDKISSTEKGAGNTKFHDL